MGAEPAPDVVGVQHKDLPWLAPVGEFLQDCQFGYRTGNDDGAGFRCPETGTSGKIEPVLSPGLGQFVQFARLRGYAAVAEVADGRADCAVVPVNDGDRKSTVGGQGRVGQADDAGTNDQDVGGGWLERGSGVHVFDTVRSEDSRSSRNGTCIYKFTKAFFSAGFVYPKFILPAPNQATCGDPTCIINS
jgi:hypothetical protein